MTKEEANQFEEPVYSHATHQRTDLNYVPTARPHEGRVYYVTGAGSGIGHASALILAKEGASLALFDISEESLENVKHHVEQAGARYYAAAFNVADLEACQKNIDDAFNYFGYLDGGVNSAGVVSKNPQIFGELDLDDWKMVMDINCNGLMACTRAALRHMKSGGSIVNISSMFTVLGPANHAAYAASKHAVLGMTKTAARGYGSKGIRINALLPGCIDTAMLKEVRQRNGITEAEQAGNAALERLAHPAEIGHFAAFLLSDKASFATGASFLIDGGYSI